MAKVEKEKRAAELVIANKELVLANKKEKLAKEKYIELYNFAPAGYLTLSREGKIIEINLCGANMLGIERHLIKNRMFGFFVSDDTKSIFNLFLKKVFNNKANETCEVNLSTNSDLQKCVRLICTASESGKQCLVNMVDITERKRAEDALHVSEEKYSKAFQSSPFSLTLTRVKDGKFIEVNDAFTSIFGFLREEAIANSVIELNLWVNEEERKWVISTLLDGRDVEGKEFLFRKKNGEIFTGLFSSKIINLNNEPRLISSINDITERKKGEEKLEKSEMLLKSVINSSENLILVVDKDLKVLMSNWKSPIYAGSTEFPIGSHCYEAFIHRDSPCEPCHVFGVFNTGKPILVEYYNQYTKLFKEVNAYPIFDDDNNVTMVVENVQDITERKQIEKKLVENESSLRNAQVIAQMGSWEWDMVTQKTKWSDNYYTIPGFKSTEVEPSFELFRSRIHPDDVHFLDENLDNLMKDKKPPVLNYG